MKNDHNHPPVPTSAQIPALISRYRSSGVGLVRFAREHGIPPGRLHYWVYQQPRGAASRRPPKRSSQVVAPTFQEVKLTARAPLTENWAAEVNLPRGFIVRFSAAARPGWIGSVVQALQRPC